MSKKQVSTKLIELGGGGQISLAEKEGSLFKRTLICRTGMFKALYGPVEITSEVLTRIANTYNLQRAKPQNENDYAPILLDHNRSVDLVKGRVLTPLTVEPWVNPETGEELVGLYGTLRVDSEDAKAKVDSGQYAHVSMSFDEDTDELYEVSFVAVEAARRSIVLSHGGTNMNLEKKVKALSLRLEKQRTTLKSQIAVRKATHLSLGENLKAASDEVTKLQNDLKAVELKLREAHLRGQFSEFVREGKLTKAEFDKVEFTNLSSLGSTALSAVVSAYASRPVSSDVQQIGQSGAQPVELKINSKEEMRRLIKLQREGKTSVDLMDDDKKKDPVSTKKMGETKEDETAMGDEQKPEQMGDPSEAIKQLEEIYPSLKKCMESIEKMGGMLKKLQDGEKDEEKLASEEMPEEDEE